MAQVQAIDIATAYFEIGSLLALKDDLAHYNKIVVALAETIRLLCAGMSRLPTIRL